MQVPTRALKLSHNNDEITGKRNVNVMIMIWQKQNINSVKNIMGHNFSSIGYFTVVYESIELNKNLKQLKTCWRKI
jgi:hypothetical protein